MKGAGYLWLLPNGGKSFRISLDCCHPPTPANKYCLIHVPPVSLCARGKGRPQIADRQLTHQRAVRLSPGGSLEAPAEELRPCSRVESMPHCGVDQNPKTQKVKGRTQPSNPEFLEAQKKFDEAIADSTAAMANFLDSEVSYDRISLSTTICNLSLLFNYLPFTIEHDLSHFPGSSIIPMEERWLEGN
ncbi:unnamed protein product [Echinostoma caproni]|uniref:TORC_N domain-containing protein n=1 Tax=Echinostoma caproni TaxID=27848 RepID=A0A183B4S0_9TREM|nr:unnamed protein product [Echinostoma caproni]